MANSTLIKTRFENEYDIPDEWTLYKSQDLGTVEFVKGELGNEIASVTVTIGDRGGHITLFHKDVSEYPGWNTDIPGKVADIDVDGVDEAYDKAVELLSEETILSISNTDD
jgi:hypothetical protein